MSGFLMCTDCKEEMRRILRQRMQDILAARGEDLDADVAGAECFHLMEMERMLDGKPTFYPGMPEVVQA